MLINTCNRKIIQSSYISVSSDLSLILRVSKVYSAEIIIIHVIIKTLRRGVKTIRKEEY